jgi:hypothetical protein
MEEYLRSTRLCNHDDPEIQKTARRITERLKIDEERALSIFHFVRDDVLFSLSYSDKKASSTLKDRKGDCASKTNLQMALLRASGIPARCHFVLCRREAIKGLVPGFIYNRMPEEASHFWCECHLSGKWIACEALLDKTLYESSIRSGLIDMNIIPTIEWNGKDDLILLKHWIVNDMGIFSSYSRELYPKGELPPKSLEVLLSWMIFPLCLKKTNEVRKLGG